MTPEVIRQVADGYSAPDRDPHRCTKVTLFLTPCDCQSVVARQESNPELVICGDCKQPFPGWRCTVATEQSIEYELPDWKLP